MSFQGKAAVITGAGSGLGRRLACDLTDRGMRLALGDLNQEGLAGTVELMGGGGQCLTRPTDVTDPAQSRALIEQAVSRLGGVDFLILCAGISMWARLDEVTDLSLYRKLMDVNYLGAVHCIHPALDSLKERRGSIVAISSLQGEVGAPYHTGYTAAKHALNGFLEALEYEISDRVRILKILPGWIHGTNLRASALKADGTSRGPARKHSRESVSVEECSAIVMRAMAGRATTVFVPPKLRYLTWINVLAPGLARALIRRAVATQKAE